MSLRKMDHLGLISNWLPQLDDAERDQITQWLRTFDVSSVTRDFTHYLFTTPSSGYWNPTVLMGGLCCFYAGLGLYLVSGSQEPLGNRADALFALTSLYMLIDTHLDTASITSTQKHDLVKRLLLGLDQPSHITTGSSNELYAKIRQHIETLIRLAPAAIPILKKLVHLEIESTLIQSQANLDLAMYRYIAEAKGGVTVQAIEAILGLPSSDEGYELGACFQLVDDLYDTRIDQADQITTLSTFLYRRDGHADVLLDETIRRIHQLPGKFNIFKIGLLMMLMACVANEPIFSQEVVTSCQKYFPVHPNFQFGESLYQRLRQSYETLKLKNLTASRVLPQVLV
jgi:hypothetical protein